jgi:hypothetical protein
MKGSWKTTTCGILGIVSAAITMIAQPILDGDPATVPAWAAFGTVVASAVGLLFARDNDKSSEDVGAK